MFIPYAPKGYIPILIKIDLFAGRFRLRREAVKTKAFGQKFIVRGQKFIFRAKTPLK